MKYPQANNLLALIMLTCAAFSLTFGAGCDSTKTTPAAPGVEIGTVDLVIEFGPSDKKTIEASVPCSEDSTVLSILDRAKNMGDLEFMASGSGDTTFIKSIGSVENEGAGGSNWIFLVNEKTGDKSAGIYSVKPADQIKWRFGTPPAELTN